MNIGHTNVLHYMNINLHTCTFSVSTQFLKDQQTFISLHFPLQGYRVSHPNSDDELQTTAAGLLQYVYIHITLPAQAQPYKHIQFEFYLCFLKKKKKNTMVNYDGYEYIIQIYSSDPSGFQMTILNHCLLLKQSTGIKIRRYSETLKML